MESLFNKLADLQACIFFFQKKQVFSCKIYESFKNDNLEDHLGTPVSEKQQSTETDGNVGLKLLKNTAGTITYPHAH